MFPGGQIHPLPLKPVKVNPTGAVSVTVTSPVVAPAVALLTVILYSAPIWPCVKLPTWLLVMVRSGYGVRLRQTPLVKLPGPPNWSSFTNICQVPLGSVPWNVEAKVAVPDGAASLCGPAGAGEGNGSAPWPPGVTLVGRNVPVESGPSSGTKEPAASSSVNVVATESVVPPASDNGTNFAPVGPTRRTSRSSGRTPFKLFSDIVTLLNTPDSPETKIRAGYWIARPLEGIPSGPGLQN